MSLVVLSTDVIAVESAISELAYLLNRSRRHEMVKLSSGVPLDRAAMMVLRQIDETGPVRPSDLAARLHVEGPHVTRQLHVLERYGFAERALDPDDRRAQFVTLTDAGRGAAQRLRQASRQFLAEALAEWSTEDLHLLGASLRRMVDDFRSHADGAGTPPRFASA